jgi:short-subunit dehydrogenase
MPTVLITGTSSGIGHAASELFASKGWHVLAGSRKPDSLRFAAKTIEPVHLDVNDAKSIAAFFKNLTAKRIPLDCVVNNAGWGLALPLEDTSHKDTEEMFRTNVFGPVEITRQTCRIMREQKKGVIIAVASVAGRVGIPLYSLYCATKWALEGFSESLAHEMRAFGVAVKIVEPGGVKTKFFSRAYGQIELTHVSEPYRRLCERRLKQHEEGSAHYSLPEEVAQTIYEAATDGKPQLRYPTGEAIPTLRERSELPDQEFFERMNKKFMEG